MVISLRALSHTEILRTHPTVQVSQIPLCSILRPSVIKASEPVVSVILGLVINGAVPKPLTAVSLLPITYGVAYASTLGQLDVVTMSRELGTMAAK